MEDRIKEYKDYQMPKLQKEKDENMRQENEVQRKFQ